ncbi:MAG: RagB/SusD family nutrient uptake outer membrane protein [Mariniphaga sp.]|jgi:starch-binding outer membrane protein, SusD/RagB family
MKKFIIFSVLLSLLICGCSEKVLNVKNENGYIGSTFFNSAEAFTEASTAMYTPLLYTGLYCREFYFIFDLLGNDAEKNFPLEGSLLEFPIYTHDANTTELNYLFDSCFKMVFRTNFVIDQLQTWKSTVSSDIDLNKRITGEAQFLRSLAYFWLVTCYGDVPLKVKLSDHYIIESVRTPAPQIWASIESTLTEAIKNLPLSYPDADYGRVTRGAAVALLGKVYLYEKKYAESATQLATLSSAPYDYALANDLDDMFVNDVKTKETIFAVMNGPWEGWGTGNAYYMFGGQETWGGKCTVSDRAMEYGFNDWWNVLVSDALVNSFTYKDPNGNSYTDPRAAKTFYSASGTFGGDSIYCDNCPDGKVQYGVTVNNGQVSWRKYEYYENVISYGEPESPINGQVIRFADVLLMQAEALIENNQPEAALPLINQVRARSGAFQYNSLGDQLSARTILRRERQIELAGEQSRFFDLVRWGTLVTTINAEKQAALGIQPVKPYHVLLPIPQSEKDANPSLAAQVKNNWN